jgi:hypothetical protein
MTLSAASITRRFALGVLAAIVVARCLPILFWADIYFDADEAVVGLMAKHASDGSAIPVFQYALKYVLMVEAWLAAPLMSVADNSVVLLKAVPVALNIVTVGLLYAMLSAGPSLGPVAAAVAVAPLALPGEIATQDLTKAIGMNIEPLLFTLALWLLRERPILLGATAAIAIKNREFALYAIAALLVIDLLRDRSAVFWRGRIAALVAFVMTWSAVELARQYSSPLGPHSSLAMLTDLGDNMSTAVGAMCIVPSMMPADVWQTVTWFLPVLFGVTSDSRSMAGAYGVAPPTAAWLWAPLVVLLIAGIARGAVRAWRLGPSPTTWLGTYLVLVGVQAFVVYALTRCGHVSTFTMRYTLLSLFIPVGALALTLEREAHVIPRAAVGGLMVLWLGTVAFGHVTLARTLTQFQPQGTYRRLATHLDERGVRYIISDYWAGYQVAFMTGERIKALTNFERVHDYTMAVRANLDRAVEVRRERETPCEGAEVVAGFYVCPVKDSSPRP